MKHKTLLAVFLFLFLTGCIKFRNPNEESAPEEVHMQNLEEATIRGEMFLYTGRIMQKEEFLAAIEENNKAIEPEVDDKDLSLNIRRLYFAPNSALYTMGKNFRLVVKNLYLDEGARIATFPEGQVAPQGLDGRSGGHLALNIGRAEGTLLIQLRGEQGGQGRTGDDPTVELRGEDAKDLGLRFSGNPYSAVKSYCPKIDEVKGGQGKQGKGGYVGRKGGDSGTMDLVVQELIGRDFEIHTLPGKPGVGGEGGRGGDGGQGGLLLCSKGKKRGATGDRGKPGDPGSGGPDGSVQTYCVTYGASEAICTTAPVH